MISYIIPTRDRPDRLAQTLRALAALGPHLGGAEIIIADNHSRTPPDVPAALPSGLPVCLLRLNENLGAAARNLAAQASDPRSAWLVMLDDDSQPLDLDFLHALSHQPADVAAVSADIVLPNHNRRESGGLPEVFIGCGVAIRRDAFLSSRGYDPTFNYYAEEYDLAAKFLLAGQRVAFEPSFCIAHHKVEAGRDMNLICERLVRNTAWVMQRYAPDDRRRAEIREVRRRYLTIAEKESAICGYMRGLHELRRTVRAQPRSPMARDLFDRFTGLAAARESIGREWLKLPFRTAALTHEGKNASVVRDALRDFGVRETTPHTAEALVIATMSPGPMLDAVEELANSSRRVIAPWTTAAQLLSNRTPPNPRAFSATTADRAVHPLPATENSQAA